MTRTAITLNAGRASQRLAPRAFTLLEVIVAMSIGLIVLGVSVLSISGVQDDNRLRRVATDIEGTVREALFEAVSVLQGAAPWTA